MTTCVSKLEPVDGHASAGSQAVHFHSRGRLLILADAPLDDVLVAADGLVEVTVLTRQEPEPNSSPASVPGVRLLHGQLMELSGWLGEFRVKFRPGGQIVAAEACDDTVTGLPTERFDLVIDLAETPASALEQPPIGYFRARSNSDLESLIGRCLELVGTFSKPRYFRYDESICAHESYGAPGCTRCLDVCSADAIVSEGSRIAVNPNLCQGCATCTLACPTGALSYVWPSRESLLRRISNILEDGNGVGATIVVCRHGAEPDCDLGDSVRLLPVEALPAFGEEIWFAALALGAGRLVLLADDETPSRILKLMSTRVALARQLLAVCGKDPDALLLLRRPEDLAGLAAIESVRPAVSRDDLEPAIKYKRLLLNRAVAALGGESGEAAIPLEAGAPWGRILIDPEKCTLCSACAEVCPSLAVRYFEDADSASAIIGFNEQRCIQCGICATACPEHAIELEPRHTGASEPESWGVASQGALANCTDCRHTFIPQKLLESALGHLRTQGGLSDDMDRQLRRCPECRARHIRG